MSHLKSALIWGSEKNEMEVQKAAPKIPLLKTGNLGHRKNRNTKYRFSLKPRKQSLLKSSNHSATVLDSLDESTPLALLESGLTNVKLSDVNEFSFKTPKPTSSRSIFFGLPKPAARSPSKLPHLRDDMSSVPLPRPTLKPRLKTTTSEATAIEPISRTPVPDVDTHVSRDYAFETPKTPV